MGALWTYGLKTSVPPIHSLLRTGSEEEIILEVLSQLGGDVVRAIALTPTQGLVRGMAVRDTHQPLKAPVGSAILSRMFNVFGNAIDRLPRAGRGSVAHSSSLIASPGAALHEIGNF